MSQANQVQIPVIQTKTEGLTQVQQNSNKVLRNINNQAVDLQNTVSKMQGTGDIILSPLSLVMFQSIHGTNWILANGQSSVGTKYQLLTNLLVVPTITITGANAFIKVN